MSQSRWVQAFNQHPLQEVWKVLKQVLAQTEVADPSEAVAVLELARLKRLIAYVDKILSSIDPELVPGTIWANFHAQAQHTLEYIQSYNRDKAIGGVVAANDHADNLLSYVRPWMVAPVEALEAVQIGAVRYSESLQAQFNYFHGSARTALDDIKANRNLAASRLKGLVNTGSKIDELAYEIFGTGDGDSLEERIKHAVDASISQHAEITSLHAKLLVDQPDQKSVRTLLKESEEKILASDKQLSALLSQADTKIAELETFHNKIFGTTDVRTGEPIQGLKQEIELRIEQIDGYEREQHKKHAAMFDKIDDLLPGANSAGLASAYKKMKESFDLPIKNYTVYFYCSLGLLGVGSLLLWVESFSLWPLALNFVGIRPWEELLRGMLGKAAFFIPVVWLAIFSATRRSQYERLQQEYAHKEAFASSYDSYKKELGELGGDTSELQKELIAKAISAVAFNASGTLDGKDHVEKPPLLRFLDKADPEVVRKWAELIAGKKGTN